MKRFILTQDSVTGLGALPAGAEITRLHDNERVALCMMGRAVAVEEKDFATKRAAVMREIAAAEAARNAPVDVFPPDAPEKPVSGPKT